jgi:hypothetical protein
MPPEPNDAAKPVPADNISATAANHKTKTFFTTTPVAAIAF